MAVVTQQEAIDEQSLLDGRDRAAYARVVRWKEAHCRQQQQTGVEFLRAIRLHEGAKLLIEAVFADLVRNDLAQPAPMVHRTIQSELFDVADRAIEGHPAHHLRVGEVSRVATNFPETVIRLLPHALEMREHRTLEIPIRVGQLQSTAPRLMQCVHDLTV